MRCFPTLWFSLTKVKDALTYSRSQKWKWPGHVARAPNNKWTKRTSLWKGPKGIRKRGRPKLRLADEMEIVAGENWLESALNRAEWQRMEEAFTHKESSVSKLNLSKKKKNLT
ncbi:jg16540 [Pararge aegeria aegeria]|uniref:Jg16540 protein n=1 Tax=Pararge aegeria aegeria TaxID=348720 RepID=A0A8S4SKH7_9NEOP|nr:jg16540 [Pararge aegeria aegeria]